MMFLMQMLKARRAIRRERVFRDCTNPLDSLDDLQLYSRYRFHHNEPLEIVQEIRLFQNRASDKAKHGRFCRESISYSLAILCN